MWKRVQNTRLERHLLSNLDRKCCVFISVLFLCKYTPSPVRYIDYELRHVIPPTLFVNSDMKYINNNKRTKSEGHLKVVVMTKTDFVRKMFITTIYYVYEYCLTSD